MPDGSVQPSKSSVAGARSSLAGSESKESASVIGSALDELEFLLFCWGPSYRSLASRSDAFPLCSSGFTGSVEEAAFFTIPLCFESPSACCVSAAGFVHAPPLGIICIFSRPVKYFLFLDPLFFCRPMGAFLTCGRNDVCCSEIRKRQHSLLQQKGTSSIAQSAETFAGLRWGGWLAMPCRERFAELGFVG